MLHLIAWIVVVMIGIAEVVTVISVLPETDEYRGDRDYQYAKKLSEDKEPEPFNGGYIIYANGTRWYLITWVTFELYWIPASLGEVVTTEMIRCTSCEFLATWLPRKKMVRLIRRIIHTHPNLEAKGYWKLVKRIDYILEYCI